MDRSSGNIRVSATYIFVSSDGQSGCYGSLLVKLNHRSQGNGLSSWPLATIMIRSRLGTPKIHENRSSIVLVETARIIIRVVIIVTVIPVHGRIFIFAITWAIQISLVLVSTASLGRPTSIPWQSGNKGPLTSLNMEKAKLDPQYFLVPIVMVDVAVISSSSWVIGHRHAI